MAVITIRGLLGSGAPEIGEMAATKLGADYVDRSIIEGVANILETSKEHVAGKETPPGSLLGRIAEAMGRGYAIGGDPASMYAGAFLPVLESNIDDNRYLAGLEAIMKELAASPLIVIQGRGSQFILKDYPDTLHLFVTAPLDLRINRVMDSLKLDKEKAKIEIDKFDSSRREFVKRYFHANLEDQLNYDIIFNTECISYETAASLAVDALRLILKPGA